MSRLFNTLKTTLKKYYFLGISSGQNTRYPVVRVFALFFTF